MDIPKHLEGNTSLIWMHQRRSGNADWMLEGLKLIETDEQGKYKEQHLSAAFELHVKGNQLIILHHPNCIKNVALFKSKVKSMLESIYSGLKDRY